MRYLVTTDNFSDIFRHVLCDDWVPVLYKNLDMSLVIRDGFLKKEHNRKILKNFFLEPILKTVSFFKNPDLSNVFRILFLIIFVLRIAIFVT